MPRTSPLYYIAPQAISITPNANNSANDLAVYIARDTRIKVFDIRINDLGTIDGTYQEWTLTGKNRRLANSDVPYTIYARLRKVSDYSSAASINDAHSDAYLVFAPQVQDGQTGEWKDPYELTPNTSTTTAMSAAGLDEKTYDWEPISERQARNGRSGYWWVKLGTVSRAVGGERTVDLDTGILGTDQYNEEWQLNPDALPLRVELTNSKTAGVPYVAWDESITVGARLVEGWDGEVDAGRVQRWTIARDTGDTDADEAWNYPDSDSSSSGEDPVPRTMPDGTITLTHTHGSTDDFNAAPTAAFIITAWGLQDGTPDTLVPLATGTITILAETVEKYELALSTHIASYNPTTKQYSPAAGIDIRVRATAQDGTTFFLTNAQFDAALLSVVYAPAGDSSAAAATELEFSGAPSAEAVATIPISAFSAQKSLDVRLSNAADVELDADSIAFVRDGEDSKEREWIYRLNSAAGYNSTTANRGKEFQDDDFVPLNWTDDPVGVRTTGDTEYASWRDWDRDLGQWGSFQPPVIWSHHGEDADVWTIGNDGYWYKNGVKTDTKAEGTDGTGVQLKGSVDVLYSADAQSGQTSLQGLTNVAVGECYVVDANRHLYFYTGEGTFPANWNDLGEFKGEPGDDSYVHIAYAEHVTISGGTVTAIVGFSVTKQRDDYAWIGLCTDHTEQDPGADAQTAAEILEAARQYEWNYVKGAPGEDAKEREWIYRLNDNTGYDNTASNRGKIFQDDDFVPVNWTDNPVGVSTQGDIEYASWRDWDKTNEEWGSFHAPVIWSNYGRNGQDGDGTEYVFILTKDGTAPVVPSSGSYSEIANNYTEDDHLPYVRVAASKDLKGSTATVTTGSYKYAKCTDDPQGTDEEWQYEWVLKRSKAAAASDGTRTWNPYSGAMSLWSNWAEDGVTYGIKTAVLGNAVDTLAIDTDQTSMELYLSLQFWKEAGGERESLPCYSQVYARKKDGTTALLRDATSELSTGYSFSRTGDNAITTDVEAVVIYISLAQTNLTTNYLQMKELPVIKNGDTGPQGPQGEQGSLGPMLYPAGKYTNNTIYRRDGNKWPYVIRPDGKAYYLNVTISSSTWVPSQWTEITQFDAFFANFGILDYGKIASAIFCGDWLYSQYGRLYDYVGGNVVSFIVDGVPHSTNAAHYKYDELYEGEEVPYTYFNPSIPMADTDDPGDYPLFAPAWAVDLKAGAMYGAAGNFILRTNGDVEVAGTIRARTLYQSFVKSEIGTVASQYDLVPGTSPGLMAFLNPYYVTARSGWEEGTIPSKISIFAQGMGIENYVNVGVSEVFLPPAYLYEGREIEIICENNGFKTNTVNRKQYNIAGGNHTSGNWLLSPTYGHVNVTLSPIVERYSSFIVAASATNPLSEKLYYHNGVIFVRCTESTPVSGRTYYTRIGYDGLEATSGPFSSVRLLAVVWTDANNATCYGWMVIGSDNAYVR